ncbi:MAG: chemotaxis protein CheD [Syntrophobacteraceae bacterium]|nr:chemotaxis protein CheD [Syntrophobacteraceae bacterium]
MTTDDKTEEIKTVSIHVGEYHACRGAAIIETLLGSCVAVCLIDPVEKIGGMNHILLPGEATIGRCDAVSRYAVNAMELLINKIMALGGDRNRLQAKIFGGAHVIPSISLENGVGRKNSNFVLQFLELERIPILSRDLGGKDTRRIYFRSDTGEVLLKRIPFMKRPPMDIQEQKLKRIRDKVEKTGDVTIFE